MEQVKPVIYETDFYMNFWGQRQFGHDYVVRPLEKKRIRGLCKQFRAK